MKKFPPPPLPNPEERIEAALRRSKKLRNTAVFWARKTLNRAIEVPYGTLHFQLLFLNLQAMAGRFEVPVRYLLKELFSLYENSIAAFEHRYPGRLPWKTLLGHTATRRLIAERSEELRRHSEDYKGILRQTALLTEMPFVPPKNPFQLGDAYVRHMTKVRRVNDGGRRPDMLPYRDSPWRSR